MSCKVLICVGCGGVGKTTLSSAIAFKAAVQGQRVLVLTIDPAQRLKTTMQITEAGHRQEIKHRLIKGQLFAEIIDAKKTFDDFILRATAQSEAVQKLLKNPLYVQLSTRLSGSQEFTSLERLYSAYESNEFDLIVLDTPPSQHALDFLEAPQKLFALFNEKLMRWFVNPEHQNFLTKILSGGTQQVLKILSKLTGASFMQELSNFFSSIQSRQRDLAQRTKAFQQILHSQEVEFCLVTSLDHAKVAEATEFAQKLDEKGYQLTQIIINRVEPLWLKEISSQDMSLAQPASEFLARLKQYYSERIKILQNSILINQNKIQVIKVPELDNNVSDLESVIEVTKWLK